MALVTAKAIFIHVPKTGGSWVRACLQSAFECRESGDFAVHDHLGLSDLDPNVVAGRFTFGFVRHPVTWLQSRWAWAKASQFDRKIADPKHPEHRAARSHWMAGVWSDEFGCFIDNYCEAGVPQAGLTFARLLERVDFLGRFEQLALDLALAMYRSGQPIPQAILESTSPQKQLEAKPHRDKTQLLPQQIDQIEHLERDFLSTYYPRK